ncbi:MAG: hypothetical protein GY703_15465 [Gammaproteobacteria bacterium]|nr:hypothetical protein [Gammaproteobacteria bacterium]
MHKAMIAGLWAQTRYGTFRIDLQQALSVEPDPQEYLALFSAFKTLRLEACIDRELPGLSRQISRLKAESPETLGDRYGIYGFFSITRKRCELYPVKGFDESYNEEVKARVSGIRP